MYIKAISSTIPGLNNTYGELYPTRKILETITREDAKIDPGFIEKVCGIKSVALTHDTLQAVSEKNPHARNNALYAMLDDSIGKCLVQLAEKEDVKDPQIKYHIHIIGFSEPILEFRLKNIRKKYKLPSDMSTYLIEQGCSGVLEALKLCEVILSGTKNVNILVTGENNMLTHVWDRYSRHASADNLDSWLWQVIFGEGVGAMVIGNSEDKPRNGCFWKVSHLEKSIVCDDWRVAEISNEGKPQIFIRARDVRQTYLQAMPEKLAKGREFFNGDENISYILHESNPKILQKVVTDMGLKNVLSISASVGTLACVSSFSLLDRVHIKQHEKGCYNNIVMALIGETHGNISGGFVCLTPFTG